MIAEFTRAMTFKTSPEMAEKIKERGGSRYIRDALNEKLHTDCDAETAEQIAAESVTLQPAKIKLYQQPTKRRSIHRMTPSKKKILRAVDRRKPSR